MIDTLLNNLFSNSIRHNVDNGEISISLNQKELIFQNEKKMNLAAKLKEIILSSPQIIEKEKLFGVYDEFIKEMIFNGNTSKESEDIFNKSLDEIKNLKINKIIFV